MIIQKTYCSQLLLQKPSLGLSQQEKSCQPGSTKPPFFVFPLAYCFRFSRRTSHKGWQNWEASHDHHQRQTPESVCVSQGWLWGLPFSLACFYYLPFFVPWELKRRTFLQCFSRRKVKHCNCKCFIFTDIIFEKIFKQVQN